jgi:hypothetical protein
MPEKWIMISEPHCVWLFDEHDLHDIKRFHVCTIHRLHDISASLPEMVSSLVTFPIPVVVIRRQTPKALAAAESGRRPF